MPVRDLTIIFAILKIAKMAIDPFTQQIVQFCGCLTVVGSEHATVLFSNDYTAGFWASESQNYKLYPKYGLHCFETQVAGYLVIIDRAPRPHHN